MLETRTRQQAGCSPARRLPAAAAGTICLVLFFMATACLTPYHLVEDRGTVALTTEISAMAAKDPATSGTLLVRMTRGKHVVETTFPINGNPGGGTVSGLMVGRWEVALQMEDQDGNIPYAGTTTVLVRKDQTEPIHVLLEPRPGTLQVVVDLTNFVDEEEVEQARLWIDSTNTSVHKAFERPPNSYQLTTTHEFSAGTHDVQIGLYRDSYHSWNQVATSYWLPVDIEPGKTTLLQWSPGTAEIDVYTDITFIPPRPTGMTATVEGDAIVVGWNAVTAGPLQGYRIYGRPDPLDAFNLLAEVSAGETTYEHQAPDPGEWAFAVSAVNDDGLEGLRSEVVTIMIE